MKKYFLILMVAVLGLGCKVAYTPVGSWDYIVAGTPNGDVLGKMVLAEMEDVFSGKLVSDQGDLDLENVKYSEENGLSCVFYFQGMEFALTGAFEGETFTGVIDGGSQVGSFPFTAERPPVE